MTDDIEHQLDRMSREAQKRVRALIAESNRPDILAEYDATMRDIELGIYGARATWAALSEVQRDVLRSLRDNGGYIWPDPRISSRCYHSHSNGMGVRYRDLTIRNLSRRNLLDWEAADTPAGVRAVLSERARFMLSKCDAL